MAQAAIMDQLKQRFGWTGKLEIRSDGPKGIVLGHLRHKERPRGEFLSILCEHPVDGISEGLSGEPSTVVTLRLALITTTVSKFDIADRGVSAIPADVPECATIEHDMMNAEMIFSWPAIMIDQEQYERLFDEDWFEPVATHGHDPDTVFAPTTPSAIDIAKRLGEETRRKADAMMNAKPSYDPSDLYNITPGRPVAATSGILASMGSTIIHPRSLFTMKTTA